MKHIHKTQISVMPTQFKDLGIEFKQEEWQDFNAVLPLISGYMPNYEENLGGQIIEHQTLLYLGSDQSFIINTPYKEFDKLMNEYYDNK